MLMEAAEPAQGLRLLCHEENPNLCPREPPEWEPVENPARGTLQIHKQTPIPRSWQEEPGNSAALCCVCGSGQAGLTSS